MSPEERKARNEAAFREVNERIRVEQHRLGIDEGMLPFVCECEDTACREIILLDATEYEAARSESAWFVLVPGHPTLGEVIEQHERYSLVEKTGVPAEIAEETDPREEA